MPVGSGLDPVSVKVIGSQQFHNQDTYQINLTFEYQFPPNWFLINVALQRKDGVSSIYGFHVRQIRDSLENLNKFNPTRFRSWHCRFFGFPGRVPARKKKMALDNFYSLWNRHSHRLGQAVPWLRIFKYETALAPFYGAWQITGVDIAIIFSTEFPANFSCRCQ